MRKWVVRGLVFLITCTIVLAVLFFRYWTDPELVRQKVIERLEHDLQNVRVHLDSARLRLFGGITLSELRVSRRVNLENRDFFYLPSAILYHDKEQLLHGTLALRKVELHNPSIYLTRDHEGRWNVTGLLHPGAAQKRLPSMVIQDGSLIIEDNYTETPVAPLEINHIHLTMVNDPVSVVSMEGRGQCNLLGPVEIRGTYSREDGAFTLHVKANAIPIALPLTQHLRGYFPTMVHHIKDLRGTCRVQITLQHRPGSAMPLHYEVNSELVNATLSHPDWPWKMENMNVSVRCIDGHVPLARLRADSGKSRFSAEVQDLDLFEALGGGMWYAARKTGVSGRHLNVNAELFTALPGMLKRQVEGYWQDYSPSGLMSFRYECTRLSRERWRRQLVLEAEKMRSTWAHFRYPIQDITGTLDIVQIGPPPPTVSLPGYPLQEGNSPFRARCTTDNVMTLDLKALAGAAPVTIKGTARGPFGASAMDVTITATDLPLNQTLVDALDQRQRDVIATFEPTGDLDVDVKLSRKLGETECDKHFQVKLKRGTVRYKKFPLLLTNASGQLNMHPDHWTFQNFVGHYKGGRVLASGRSHPQEAEPVLRRTTHVAPALPQPPSRPLSWDRSNEPPKPQRVALRIEGVNIPLDQDFERTLTPGREGLARAWRVFEITGQMSFVAVIDDLPDRPQDMDVTISVGGCRMRPAFFPYPLEEVSGTARYVADSVHLYNLRGKHGKTELLVDRGTILLKKQGGFWAELKQLRARSLILDEDFLKALPRVLREACEGLELKEPVNCNSRLVIDENNDASVPPTVYWSTMIDLDKATLQTGVKLERVDGKVGCVGLYEEGRIQDIVGRFSLSQAYIFNQPFKKVAGRFAVWKKTPDVLRVWDLQSDLFGGNVGGQVRIELGSIFRYELILKALGIQLERFGQHNLGKSAELNGLATIGLYLRGKGRDLSGLTGNGTIDVPEGKMYRLPLLLDLLKWLGLRLPDRTAFEQAHARFTIEGPRANVEELNLYGNAISVRGAGSMRLDGSDLDLTLHADWGRLSQFLPSSVNKLTRGISNQLLRIKVRGSVSDAKFEKELVPMFANPLKKVFQGFPSP